MGKKKEVGSSTMYQVLLQESAKGNGAVIKGINIYGGRENDFLLDKLHRKEGLYHGTFVEGVFSGKFYHFGQTTTFSARRVEKKLCENEVGICMAYDDPDFSASHECGKTDDAEFSANDMCCACGGGTFSEEGDGVMAAKFEAMINSGQA